MRAGRLLAALVVAALLAAAGALPAVASPAATSAAVRIVVAPRGAGVVRDGSPLDVDVQLTNSGTAPLPAGRLTFSLDRAPAANADELLSNIANPQAVLLGRLLTRTKGRTPAVAPGASATVQVRIPAADLRETLDSADGARSLYVQLNAGTLQQVAESAVVQMSSTAPRIGFGTIIAVTAPKSSTGLVDTDSQASLTRPGGAWSRALDAAEAMPSAAVALDPEVIASIRLAGSGAPASARSFLADLQDLPNEFLRLPYADGDVALQRAAGVTVPLAPTTFDGIGVASSPSATPAPTSSPATSGGAGSDSPTAWQWSRTSAVWPVPGTTDAGALVGLGQQGAVLLGSGDVRDTPQRAAAGPLATVGGTRVLVADAATSELLVRAGGDDAQAHSAAAALLGALATDAVTGSARVVLAVPGRGSAPAGLDGVLRLLDDQSWVRGASIGSMAAASSPAAVRLRDGLGVPASRVAVARALVGAEQEVGRLSAAVDDGSRLLAPYRLSLLGLLSAAWRGDDAGWTSAAETARSTFAAAPRQVSIDDLGSRTAIGVDGELKFTVSNRLAQAVTVEVTPSVDNGRLQFTGSRTAEISVQPHARAPGVLHFRPIANGRTVVTLTLTTPDGVPLGPPSRTPVTVQAGFDFVVAVVLLTALALLLALGVYRNVVRRRRKALTR